MKKDAKTTRPSVKIAMLLQRRRKTSTVGRRMMEYVANLSATHFRMHKTMATLAKNMRNMINPVSIALAMGIFTSDSVPENPSYIPGKARCELLT